MGATKNDFIRDRQIDSDDYDFDDLTQHNN